MDLTNQNSNKEIITKDIFDEFIDGMVTEIERWVYNNHYPALYMAPKRESQHKLYGNNFEIKEFRLLYHIWRSFYHIFERKTSISKIERESEISITELTNNLSDKRGSVFSVISLLKISKILEDYKNSLARDDYKGDIIEDTLTRIDDYILFRSDSKKDKKRENYFLEGRLGYNQDFNFDETRMPNDLPKLKNYLTEQAFLEGGASLNIRNLILSTDKKFKNSISRFSKGPFTTGFIKKDYIDFFSEFTREIINNEKDLEILKKLNDLAKRRDMREKMKTQNDGQPHHIWYQEKAFKLLDDMVVVSDMFVFHYDDETKEMVYGHIDLIVIIGKNIYVCDYKPELNFDLRSGLINNHFCDSIPQISVYALVLEKMFGEEFKKNGYNVFCYTFRDTEGYIYNPKSALEAYSAFYISQRVEDPPWMFLLSEPSREEWVYWYERYLN
ncbi:MAG: hypothetical protein GF311_11690 [Candidatus Lokiarchaeota archaeon]|nr:hypothetical protein [Candidatus Lokiarchaeota archaeon]